MITQISERGCLERNQIPVIHKCQNLIVHKFMYSSWCIENLLTLKTENTVLQVRPWAIIVHVVLQQYAHDVYWLRHYYAWSFSGIFQQVFFFIPVSVSIECYIQQHFHS